MDDQNDLNAVQQMDEENPEPTPEVSTVETPAEELPAAGDSMEVDEATFEDALESFSDVPQTEPENVEEVPKVAPEEEDKNMSTEVSGEVEEQVKLSEINEEEPNKEEGEQPHAMEIHDVPEHDQETEDPNVSVAPSEKSIDVTLLNSSAIDPFDTVKQTSTNDESVAEKDPSDVNETAATESELEQTTADVDTTTPEKDDDDNNSVAGDDVDQPEKEVSEDLEQDQEPDQEQDEAEKDDETSQQKETEEVADGKFNHDIFYSIFSAFQSKNYRY